MCSFNIGKCLLITVAVSAYIYNDVRFFNKIKHFTPSHNEKEIASLTLLKEKSYLLHNRETDVCNILTSISTQFHACADIKPRNLRVPSEGSVASEDSPAMVLWTIVARQLIVMIEH